MNIINEKCKKTIEDSKEFYSLLNSLEESYNKILDSEIVIFGAGNTSVLYQPCFEYEDINPLYFCDNNKEKQGTMFLGKEVISPEKVKVILHKPIILICSAIPEICIAMKEQCINLGIEAFMLDEIIFYKHREKIIDNYLSLADEVSKKVYANIIMSRIYGLTIDDENYQDDQYFAFLPFMRRRNSEVFVDCGAYVGDSIEKYIWKKGGCFQKIYGFEPDKVNFARMETRVKRLEEEWGFENGKINLVLGGVGAQTTKMFIEETTASSVASKISSEGEEGTDIYALDEYFKDIKISFLKADIESYESKMIEGAKNIIKRDKPLLAISIYHNAMDMYYVMQQIRKLNPTYKFGIRHHSVEFCETVLYAW